MPKNKTPPGKLLERLLVAAWRHGLDSDPDHEVGDLQDILRTCWGHLSEDQANAVFAQHKDLIEEWPGREVSGAQSR